MHIEALEPSGGIARASIDGIQHFRLCDAVAGYFPKTHVGSKNIAIAMFRDRTPELIKVPAGKLKARGWYAPLDQFNKLHSFLDNPVNRQEISDRFYACRAAAVAKQASRQTTPSSFAPPALTVCSLSEDAFVVSTAHSPRSSLFDFLVKDGDYYFCIRDMALQLLSIEPLRNQLRGITDRVIEAAKLKPRIIRHRAGRVGGAVNLLPFSAFEEFVEAMSHEPLYESALRPLLKRAIDEVPSMSLPSFSPVAQQIVAKATPTPVSLPSVVASKPNAGQQFVDDILGRLDAVSGHLRDAERRELELHAALQKLQAGQQDLLHAHREASLARVDAEHDVGRLTALVNHTLGKLNEIVARQERVSAPIQPQKRSILNLWRAS